MFDGRNEYPRSIETASSEITTGDQNLPGSGKTTLLRYLALLYARNLAEGSALVQTHLVATEPARLPIVLPLRQLGGYLREAGNPNVEGCRRCRESFLGGGAKRARRRCEKGGAEKGTR